MNITIILATFNRSDVLARTLDAFAALDTRGLNVEWVVVDNNSSDNTQDILHRYEDKVPLLALFEGRPGKNCALNKGLDSCDLGDVVVFTDDDVTPREDWLQAISRSVNQNPDYSVFGGRVIVQWPSLTVPEWAERHWIKTFAFAQHDLGSKEKAYAPGQHPFGPNFWVRRDVLSNNRRYNESIGPHPTNRIMGSETTFLIALREDGYQALYYPASEVRHRISETEIDVAALETRGYRLGRGMAHTRPMPYERLFGRSRCAWFMLQRFLVAWSYLKYLGAFRVLSYTVRVEKKVGARIALGFHTEAIRKAKAEAHLK